MQYAILRVINAADTAKYPFTFMSVCTLHIMMRDFSFLLSYSLYNFLIPKKENKNRNTTTIEAMYSPSRILEYKGYINNKKEMINMVLAFALFI